MNGFYVKIYCNFDISITMFWQFRECIVVICRSLVQFIFWPCSPLVLSDTLLFLRNISVASCSVLVFCKRAFPFIFWKFNWKNLTKLISHVSSDLNKTGFSLIVWTLWKKFEISSELICPWLSILGSKTIRSLILASSRGILLAFLFSKEANLSLTNHSAFLGATSFFTLIPSTSLYSAWRIVEAFHIC